MSEDILFAAALVAVGVACWFGIPWVLRAIRKEKGRG